MFPAAVFLAQTSPRGTAAMRRSSRGGVVVSADFLRETPIAAMLLGGSGVPDRGVAHLAHLRPVFASPNFVRPMLTAVPAVAVFERVRGARLVGLVVQQQLRAAVLQDVLLLGDRQARVQRHQDRAGGGDAEVGE